MNQMREKKLFCLMFCVLLNGIDYKPLISVFTNENYACLKEPLRVERNVFRVEFLRLDNDVFQAELLLLDNHESLLRLDNLVYQLKYLQQVIFVLINLMPYQLIYFGHWWLHLFHQMHRNWLGQHWQTV